MVPQDAIKMLAREVERQETSMNRTIHAYRDNHNRHLVSKQKWVMMIFLAHLNKKKIILIDLQKLTNEQEKKW
jgi:hypothetical protein